MKYRKIIAREGLIIISLIFISAVFFYLDHWQSTNISKIREPSLKEFRSFWSKVKKIDEKKVVCPKGFIINFESKPTEEDIFEACAIAGGGEAIDFNKIPDKQLFDIANIPMKERPFMQRLDFLSLGLIFPIFIYLFFWLVRFVFWAIKTLKEKSNF
ncbi:MAG: hypothetical protein ACOYVJ_13005 [Nitrospirota bacterium]